MVEKKQPIHAVTQHTNASSIRLTVLVKHLHTWLGGSLIKSACPKYMTHFFSLTFNMPPGKMCLLVSEVSLVSIALCGHRE